MFLRIMGGNKFMEETSVYEMMYDIVAENMKAENDEMEFSKEAFLFDVNRKLGEVDIADMLHMDNKTFLEAAYLGFLGRLPDEGAIIGWSEKAENLDCFSFQSQVVNSMLHSAEFRTKNVKVYNCIYSLLKRKRFRCNESIEQTKSKVILKKGYIYNIMLKIYRKMPEKIKHIIRKVCGRG